VLQVMTPSLKQFFGDALAMEQVFVPQNCPRDGPRWNMINICSIEQLLSREQWDKIDLNLFCHIAPGTNFMLHRVFCCIAEKKSPWATVFTVVAP